MRILILFPLLAAHLTYAAAFEPPQPAGNEFHFVVLGDAQFDQPAVFNRVIDQAQRLNPAFVIQVGDLIEGYNSDLDLIGSEWDRFEKQVAPLGDIPYLPVPGNHDLYGSAKVPDRDLEALYEERWGPLYFAFEYGNTLIVGLNSDSTEGANEISGSQLRWLQRTLAGSSARHKFAFMHRPPMFMTNSRELHDLFREHDVSHVFYGHHHHYHYQEIDGIRYLMTNAAADSAHSAPEIGGFHHLLQVTVRDDTVAVAVIAADAVKPVDYVVPADNYDLFSITRNLVPKTVDLDSAGSRRYRFNVPLNNTSRRTVDLFISCDSDDERWIFEPAAIDPVRIDAQSSTTLELEVSYAESRQPESVPECHVRLPYQTRAGQWLDFSWTVKGDRGSRP